jgi:ubiquinone biosynthesis protein UbiJ
LPEIATLPWRSAAYTGVMNTRSASSADTLAQWLLPLLNRLIRLDPAMPARLARLEGRRVALRFSRPDFTLALTVRDGQLVAADADPADLALDTTPGALLALIARRQGLNVPAGKVSIAGDVELAQQLEALARDFRPDVEELFAKAFGDVLGVQLAQGGKRFADWALTRAKDFGTGLVEYLREERRDLIAVPELEAHAAEVAEVRDAVERAELRIRRLEARRRSAAP